MTPNARYAAAIDCLTRILEGDPAEKTLTNWARSNRYAGSKDRAAVRDIVFDCLRQKRSLMHLAGFDSARGLAVGHILVDDGHVGDVFTGEGYAPAALTDAELAMFEVEKETPTTSTLLDIPDWIEPKLQAALGEDFETSLKALQMRAPLDLRVNAQCATPNKVQAALVLEDIDTSPVEGIPNALRVLSNPRRVAQSKVYQSGQVEIQDAGSQAIAEAIPLEGVNRVLDYCAGGGGKTLALAASANAGVQFDAYDQSKARMNDLPERAKRAGVSVRVMQIDPVLVGKPYDLVLLDVPCSGTGAWRRNPDGKWRFSDQDLRDLQVVQANILTKTQSMVAKAGTLAYVTCSLLLEENEHQVETFLTKHKEWRVTHMKRYHPSCGTDGFFLALFQR